MADGTKTTDLTEVNVSDLETELAKMDDVDALRAARKADDRVTARPLYDARIEALAAPKAAPPSPAARAAAAKAPAETTSAAETKSGGAPREARTRVKYRGTWYAPGDTVPFESAKDAEPYDAGRALAAAAKK